MKFIYEKSEFESPLLTPSTIGSISILYAPLIASVPVPTTITPPFWWAIVVALDFPSFINTLSFCFYVTLYFTTFFKKENL